MSTKQIELVCINNGENVGTYSPHCFLSSFNGDINETCNRCLSWDDDRQVETALYKTYKITIPEWMTETFYMMNSIKFHFLIALVGNWGYTLNKEQLLKVMELNEVYQYFLGWLFKGNTKSTFKLDIREKCMSWINGDNNYPKPLSNSQFNAAAKFCKLYDAQKITNNLYYSREYWLV